MKFEIGKEYVCRDGQIAVYVGEDKCNVYPETFVIGESRFHFTRDGMFWNNGVPHRLDIIKEQPMQIEAGKYYKTRDGRKAFVAGVLLPNPLGSNGRKFPIVGYMKECSVMLTWTTNGLERDSSKESPLDLVSEWSDPPAEITIDGVVYVRKES